MPSKDFRFGISGSVQGLDLNQLLVLHAVSTFYMRVAVEIPELELHGNDILIVDRSLKPKRNELVVIAKNDDPELKIMRYATNQVGELWGVVTNVIRKVRV